MPAYCTPRCGKRHRNRKARQRRRGDGPPACGMPWEQSNPGVAGVAQAVRDLVAAAARCDRQGKIAYPGEQEAWADLHRINARSGLGLDAAYECPGCGRWHLTSHGYTAVRITVRGRGETGLLGNPGQVISAP